MRRSPALPAVALLVALPLVASSLSLPLEGAEPARESPPALAALVTGDCAVRTASTAAPSPLRLLEPIPAGAVVETGPASRLVVVFLTGERFELGPDSSALVAGSAVDPTRGTVRPLPAVSPRVALAPLAATFDVSRRAGAVRVRSEARLTMYPYESAALDANDAVLRYLPVPGAERYAVAVEDEAGNTVFSAQTRATHVALPQGVLRDAAVYFWRVRPRGPGLSGTGREERFVTLSAEEARRWKDARESLSASDPSLSNLLSATASSLGLRREACLGALAAEAAATRTLGASLGCGALAPFLSPE